MLLNILDILSVVVFFSLSFVQVMSRLFFSNLFILALMCSLTNFSLCRFPPMKHSGVNKAAGQDR